MAKSEKGRDDFVRAAGFRSLRLEELFREEMNSLLESEVSDPRLERARVTRVELSRDGSRARVWFALVEPRGAPSGDEAAERREPAPNIAGVQHRTSPDAAREAFEHAAGFFRSRLCDAVSLKRFPELRFRYDPVLVLDEDPHSLDAHNERQGRE